MMWPSPPLFLPSESLAVAVFPTSRTFIASHSAPSLGAVTCVPRQLLRLFSNIYLQDMCEQIDDLDSILLSSLE